MGTWIVHLRIAEHFMNTGNIPDLDKFTVGSVAPDCGWGKKDSIGKFSPPPSVTHWTDSGKKIHCKYKDFYNEYILKCTNNSDFSFYLGYYIHLLTDVIWSSQVYYPQRLKYFRSFEDEKTFLSAIKKEWNDLDLSFLQSHPNFVPLEILKQKKEVPQYLPYYEPEQLTIQCGRIADFYSSEKINSYLPHDFTYFNESAQNNIVNSIIEIIETDLAQKGTFQLQKKICAI